MRRMLEMLVYGILASAQLAVTLLLVGHYTHGAAPVVPAQGTSNIPQVTQPVRAPEAPRATCPNRGVALRVQALKACKLKRLRRTHPHLAKCKTVTAKK